MCEGMRIRACTVGFVLALGSICAPARAQETRPASDIGYPSVAAALEALRARPDVSISEQDGWTIVNDAPNNTVWSFTPPGHPAHPAAVKRVVVEKAGAIYIDMSALCGAEKRACDQLVEEFKALNQKTAQAVQQQKASGDSAEIERLTYRYFSAKDNGSYREAFEMMRPDVAPLESWVEATMKFNVQAGKVLQRRIRKVTWYKDPPNAQLPGVYAAADYVSHFEHIDTHCGYVVWHREDDGTFRVMREEQNFIDKKTQAGLDERKLAELKARFRCQ
jgi:hypothetical protein